MKKIISTLILCGLFSFHMNVTAQDSDAEDGFEQMTLPCPNNTE